MGLVIDEKNIDKLRRIAERERSPFYVIGEATGDMQFTFVDNRTGEKPIDLKLEDMFGKAPAHGARGSDGRGAVRRAPLYGPAV